MRKSCVLLCLVSLFLSACISVPPTTYAPVKKLSAVPMMNDSCGYEGYRFEFLHEDQAYYSAEPSRFGINVRYNSLDKINIANLSCIERFSMLRKLANYNLLNLRGADFYKVMAVIEQEIQLKRVQGSPEQELLFIQEFLDTTLELTQSAGLTETTELQNLSQDEIKKYVGRFNKKIEEMNVGGSEAIPISAPNTNKLSLVMSQHAVVALCYVLMDVSAEGTPQNVVSRCNYEPYEEVTKKVVMTARFQPRMENGKPVMRRQVMYPFDLRIE